MAKQAEYASRYQDRFLAQVRRLAEGMSRGYGQGSDGRDLTKIFARMEKAGGPDLHDAWGTELRMEPVPWYRRSQTYYLIRSAGADRQFDTGDDLTLYIEVRTGTVTRQRSTDTIKFKIEHDRGPFNGLAEITGTVTDPSGAMVPNAEVEVREVSSGKTRNAKSDAAGQFDLAGIPAGKYQVQVSSLGFKIAARVFAVQARDRAVLSVALNVGAVTEAVEVTGAAPPVFARGGDFALAMPMAAPGRGMAMHQQLGMARAKAVGGMGGVIGGLVTMTSPGAVDEGPAAHVRSYFPEALYINPEIITDKDGRASIVIPIADSITTWRMAMIASTQHGALGTSTSSLKVFQDFFVDLDLPVTLTQGDRVSIPVAIYNYSGSPGEVSLNSSPTTGSPW